jgi:hypothetical protein
VDSVYFFIFFYCFNAADSQNDSRLSLRFIQQFFGYWLFRIKKGITFARPFGEEKA